MRIELTKDDVLRRAKDYLEDRSYDPRVSNGEADERIQRKLKAARHRGHMVLDDLRAIAKWKYPGPKLLSLVEENTSDEVAEITRLSFSATNERLRIEALRALRGVDWRMASVILHFAFPGQYPILDKRVMCAIDVPCRFTFESWIKVTKFLREKSREFGVTMRELDRALWVRK